WPTVRMTLGYVDGKPSYVSFGPPNERPDAAPGETDLWPVDSPYESHILSPLSSRAGRWLRLAAGEGVRDPWGAVEAAVAGPDFLTWPMFVKGHPQSQAFSREVQPPSGSRRGRRARGPQPPRPGVTLFWVDYFWAAAVAAAAWLLDKVEE